MKATASHLLLTMCLLLLTWCAAGQNAVASPIDADQAAREAERLLSQRSPHRGKTSPQRAKAVPVLTGQSPSSFLFQTADGEFALIAADDCLPAVLGYGSYVGTDLKEALKNLVTDYDRALRLAGIPRSGEFPAAKPVKRKALPTNVEPLLRCRRHQEAPFNAQCPYYLKSDGTLSKEPCVVGCVATTLEMILSYHKRLYVLQDTLHGWETEHYTIPDVLPGEQVDARLIRDDYTGDYSQEEADAVARLSYWMGVAAHMSWGTGSSGANSEACVEPLRKAFGLEEVFYADSYQYDPDDWTLMLKTEIAAGRPVYYAAHTMRLNGHAFVLDGYDDNGYFHVNWAYDGEYDGYFNLSVLYSAEPIYDQTPNGFFQGFTAAHEAIFISPEASGTVRPDTLERSGSEFEITAWQLEASAMKTAYTPLRVTIKNHADRRLTTPMEFFTNLPTDTAYIEQGDYVGLLGLTLEAGEEKDILVHLRFDEKGERLLRVTTDGKNIQTLGEVGIASYQAATLSFSDPVLSIEEDKVAHFTTTVSNTSESARAGVIITYQLRSTETDEPLKMGHAHYTYLAPEETLTDTVSFRNLEYGKKYTLIIRCPWTIKKTLDFVMTAPVGIREISTENDALWYTLEGKPIKSPAGKGVFIRNRKKVFIK